MPRTEVKKQDYLDNLNAAHTCAQKALDALYDPRSGVKRSLWYRMLLGRAQSILISLYSQELKRQKEELE